MINEIAKVLNVEVSQIKKVQEFAHVWMVVVAGKRPTFVSKKKLQSEIKTIESMLWCLQGSTRKKWVARIDGICPRWGFTRTFLNANRIEWGKKGMKYADFEIMEPGYYQDSDGDYFKAVIIDGAIQCEICSKMEVSYEMKFREQAVPVAIAA